MTAPKRITGHWSSDEDDLLHELPWGAQLLYLRCLRRFVSRDGVVGIKRRISRRMMIETLTVPQQRGRHSDEAQSPTVSTLRHLLDVLIKAGLIAPVPGHRKALVFRLPYVLQDQSVPRMSAPMSDTMSDTMSAPFNPHSGAGFEGISAPMSDTMSAAMSAPHQSKAVIGSNSSAYRSPRGAHEVSAIGGLCMRLRHEASMLDAVPHRTELIALVNEGIDLDMIVDTAIELSARGRGAPNVGYLVGTVRGRIRDSESTEVGYAGSSGRRQSVCEQIEQQDREYAERERRSDSHLTLVR
jgi:hypothetical protein